MKKKDDEKKPEDERGTKSRHLLSARVKASNIDKRDILINALLFRLKP